MTKVMNMQIVNKGFDYISIKQNTVTVTSKYKYWNSDNAPGKC